MMFIVYTFIQAKYIMSCLWQKQTGAIIFEKLFLWAIDVFNIALLILLQYDATLWISIAWAVIP